MKGVGCHGIKYPTTGDDRGYPLEGCGEHTGSEDEVCVAMATPSTKWPQVYLTKTGRRSDMTSHTADRLLTPFALPNVSVALCYLVYGLMCVVCEMV